MVEGGGVRYRGGGMQKNCLRSAKASKGEEKPDIRAWEKGPPT